MYVTTKDISVIAWLAPVTCPGYGYLYTYPYPYPYPVPGYPTRIRTCHIRTSNLLYRHFLSWYGYFSTPGYYGVLYSSCTLSTVRRVLGSRQFYGASFVKTTTRFLTTTFWYIITGCYFITTSK